MPLWCAEEIAPVRAISLPKIALSNVDLPTPEFPDNRVTRLWKMSYRGDEAIGPLGDEARSKAEMA